jgi:amidase
LADNGLDLIAGQSNGVAWVSTLGNGDKFNPPSISQLPAVAGYPHLTLPMGAIDGLPIGLSLIGPKWSDALVLRAGHAFEVTGPSLRVVPNFAATTPIQKEP